MLESPNPSAPPGLRPASGAGQDRAGSTLDALLHPSLDPLFAAPSVAGADGDWLLHLPFLGWLVQAARPATLVALGDTGGAYDSCCDVVAGCTLPTRCVELRDERPPRADDRRHAAFSRSVAGTAAGGFGDAAIDLLIVDPVSDPGWRGEEAPARLADWRPKLSARAVLLLHGTETVHAAPLWRLLQSEHPVFEFRQGAGLGVVACGTVPPGLASLFALADDSAGAARLRARMTLLGERWRADSLARAASQTHDRQAADDRRSLEDMQDRLRALSLAHDRLRDELAFSKADRYRLERDAAASAAQAQDAAGSRRHDEERAAERTAAALAEMGARLERMRDADRHALADLATRTDADRAAERADTSRRLAEARAETTALRASLDHAGERARTLEDALAALQRSASWRVTRPLRTLRAALRGAGTANAPALPAPPILATPVLAPPEPAEAPIAPDPSPVLARKSATVIVPTAPAEIVSPDAAPPPPIEAEPATSPDAAPGPARVGPGGWRPIRRILFVAGEPGTPGAAYRTARNAAACRAAGWEAECVDIAGVDPHNLAAADLVVLWRAGFSGHVQTMLELARHARTRVVFDVDDLIVQPSLAIAEIIDGIRTTFVSEAESRAYFQSMQHTMLNCDLCTTTTRELAAAIGQQHPMVRVLPNAFDAEVARISRRAVRLRGERAADGLVRLGYAGGTRTHQKDFALIVPSLATVLRERPQAGLVLFRDGRSGEGLVLVEEFPELLPFADRIEWRDLVPLAELPFELARFDVSLCPLELGNPFCEAKSELKYFESALAGVCLVATPTGPFRRAVQDGTTGFLPADQAGWTGTLLRLVDDPLLRRRVARAAANDVSWRFGPRRQAELWALLLAELDGGAAGARAADLALRRGDHPPAGLPEVPDGELLFSHDRLGEAEVTVGMTSFNYESFIGEALDSVSAQTLERIDLVVVDDGSRDGSVALLLDWAERNRERFNRLRVLRTVCNAGLGGARNLVFDQAETPWVMVLDSDNRLAPEACETLLRAAEADGLAALAYPRIRQFGGADAVMGADDFQPSRLAAGNYIDAMALVAKWAWAAAGGYYVRRDAMGWEDFSLWCRLVELGLHGVPVAEELAFYRVHATSMVNAITEQSDNKRAMVGFVERRHPWLRLRMRAVRKRLDRPDPM